MKVYIVLDPVQDYEESNTIWGVYDTLEHAQRAVLGQRKRRLDRRSRKERYSTVEQWENSKKQAVWRYGPTPQGWQEQKVIR